MGFILQGIMFYPVSRAVCGVWLFVPPLVQPAAIVLGPLFVFLESPRAGRTYASLTVFSMVSVTAATLLKLFHDLSLLFDLFLMVIICVLKVLVCVLTEIHLGHLEALRDEGRMETCQRDFLGVMFSQNVSIGPTESGQHGLEGFSSVMESVASTQASLVEWEVPTSKSPRTHTRTKSFEVPALLRREDVESGRDGTPF